MNSIHGLFVMKLGCFVGLLITTMLMPDTSFSTTSKTNEWFDKPVSLRCQSEPLSSVLGKIAQQTGISIVYDYELANKKVNISYKDVKASDAITRLFRGENSIIQTNNEKKVIIVKTFGAKSFVWTNPSNSNDSSSRMTLAELEEIVTRQYKDYKDRITDDNEILEGKMTRGELRTNLKKQYEDYQRRIANDQEMLEGEMTRGELHAILAKQYEDYQKRIADDQEMLEGKMTRGELRDIHALQYKNYQSRVTNEQEILDGEISQSELRAMHEIQYQTYKERLKGELIVPN